MSPYFFLFCFSLQTRDMYISDIYRSIGVKHASTYDWRGISLSRLELQDKDLQTSNCSWAWPQVQTSVVSETSSNLVGDQR